MVVRRGAAITQIWLAERVGFEPIVQFAVNMALSSNAGIADRTSFAPATTFPERNERKQTRTKTGLRVRVQVRLCWLREAASTVTAKL